MRKRLHTNPQLLIEVIIKKMELFVELHDDSVVLKTFQHTFQNEDTMKELEGEIISNWGISLKQLWFSKDGKKLKRSTTRTLQSYGLKNGDKIVAKHVSISYWKVFKDYIRLMSIQGSDKFEHAEKAFRIITKLYFNDFFDVYPHFKDFKKQTLSELKFWMNNDIVLMCKAAKQYFRNLHDQKRGNEESEFTCYFEKRDEELGSREFCVIAFVRIHGEDSVSKYNVKSARRFGARKRGIGIMPDIAELWCYKLLELIGVGPKCHFIPPDISNKPRTITYIITLWDDEFELLADILDENRLCADVVAQIELLRVLLFIHDLSEENCGKWKGTKNAAIVGFGMIDNRSVVFSNIKNEILPRTTVDYRWSREYAAVKNQYDEKSWLAITKMYLEKWDFPKNIELARKQFDPNDTLIGILDTYNMNWDCNYTPSKDLDEFIIILYKNVENLQTLLNSDD